MQQTEVQRLVEKARTQHYLMQIADLEKFIADMRDEDNADDLKRALSDAYDNATSKWAELTSGTDNTGDDLISDQEIALAADRADDAKVINAENQVRR